MMWSLFVAALGGFFGYVISWVFLNPKERLAASGWITVGCAGLSVMIFVPNNFASYTDEQTDAEMERLMQAEPAIRTLKSAQPDDYDEIRDLVGSAGADPQARAELPEKIGKVIGARLEERLPTAPDATLRRVAQLLYGATYRLKQNPTACAALLQQKGMFGAGMADRELSGLGRSIYLEALVMPPLTSPKIATDDEVDQFTANAVRQILNEADVSQQKIFDAIDGEGDPTTVCKVGAAYFRILSGLPAERAGPLVRRMLDDN